MSRVLLAAVALALLSVACLGCGSEQVASGVVGTAAGIGANR